jgi:hypothetical protein
MFSYPEIGKVFDTAAFTNPLVMLWETQAHPDVLTNLDFGLPHWVYLGFVIAATAVFYFAACRDLRELAFRERRRSITRVKQVPQTVTIPTGEETAIAPTTRHWADPPAIGFDEDGLYWKEKYFTSFGSKWLKRLRFIPSYVWILGMVTFGMMLMATFASDVIRIAAMFGKIVGFAYLLGLLSVVGMSACSAITRERQKETLVDLVMIPTDRQDILTAKWWGAMYQGRNMAYGFVALLIVSILCQGLSYLALPMLIFLGWVWRAVAVSFGLYLSVVCKSVQRASAYWVLGLFCWLGLTMLLNQCLKIGFTGDSTISLGSLNQLRPDMVESLHFAIWFRHFVLPEVFNAFTPVSNWMTLTFVVNDGWCTTDVYGVHPLRDGRPLIAAGIGVLLQFVLIRKLWRMTCQRFESEIIK